jgi:hypothetical protein
MATRRDGDAAAAAQARAHCAHHLVGPLLTGVLQAVATKWGLVRHCWVVIKLLITIVATIVLLLYLQTSSYPAHVAAQAPSSDLRQLRSPSPVLHAAGALLVLLAAVTLSVYRPRGMTRYGWRKQHDRQATP